MVIFLELIIEGMDIEILKIMGKYMCYKEIK